MKSLDIRNIRVLQDSTSLACRQNLNRVRHVSMTHRQRVADDGVGDLVRCLSPLNYLG